MRRFRSNPYSVDGITRRRHPRFADTKEGREASEKYSEQLNRESERMSKKALSDAVFDARHQALREAKASALENPLDALVGWDREAVSIVMQMQSAERVGHALTRATFILAFATLALVASTVALVIVTILH